VSNSELLWTSAIVLKEFTEEKDCQVVVFKDEGESRNRCGSIWTMSSTGTDVQYNFDDNTVHGICWRISHWENYFRDISDYYELT